MTLIQNPRQLWDSTLPVCLPHSLTTINKSCCIGRRHVVTILGFAICCLMNANRLVLGVAIVAMVKHDGLNESLHRNESELSCPLRSTTSSITKSQIKGEFDWDSKQQGYIIGVGFLGYLIFQVLGGKVADTVGAKLPLVASNILMGIFTFISPFASWWNIYAILITQFFRGVTQSNRQPHRVQFKINSYYIAGHRKCNTKKDKR
ncbi:inorganic phosphate cotransporter [Trichonephila clavipes]|nr:inorganic phosphate cotransporter [Trichonephila clavipes]